MQGCVRMGNARNTPYVTCEGSGDGCRTRDLYNDASCCDRMGLTSRFAPTSNRACTSLMLGESVGCARHVEILVERGIGVLVQPSSRRIYSDAEYAQAGARVQEDVSDASFLMGVKQPRISTLLANRTYSFFSHTIKGQPENMPLLDSILNKKIRMLDYECIRSSIDGKRIVSFSHLAGCVGAVNALRALGFQLLAHGHTTPFLYIGPAFSYPTLKEMKQAVSRVGQKMMDNHQSSDSSAQLRPLIVCLTGSSSAYQGALEMLQLLPHSVHDVESIDKISSYSGLDDWKLHIIQVVAKDMVRAKDMRPFVKEHYYGHPELYDPVFHMQILPHINVLIHCSYWDQRFPTLVTWEQLSDLHSRDLLRLQVIIDVTADTNGGALPFSSTFTTTEEPYALLDVSSRTFDYPGSLRSLLSRVHSINGQVLLSTVNALPAELPIDAVEKFGTSLLPYVEQIAKLPLPMEPEAVEAQEHLPSELKWACVTDARGLAKNFSYIRSIGIAKEQRRRLRGNEDASVPFAKQMCLKGHLLNTGIISEVFDLASEVGGCCRILAWELGTTKWIPSHAIVILSARSALELENLLARVRLISSDGPLEEEDASRVPPIQLCQWVMFRLFHLTALEPGG